MASHVPAGVLKLIVKAYIDDILRADVSDQRLKDKLVEMRLGGDVALLKR